jgi:hypothetical protein
VYGHLATSKALIQEQECADECNLPIALFRLFRMSIGTHINAVARSHQL